MRKRIVTAGFTPAPPDGPPFGDHFSGEVTRWAKLIGKAYLGGIAWSRIAGCLRNPQQAPSEVWFACG